MHPSGSYSQIDNVINTLLHGSLSMTIWVAIALLLVFCAMRGVTTMCRRMDAVTHERWQVSFDEATSFERDALDDYTRSGSSLSDLRIAADEATQIRKDIEAAEPVRGQRS